MLKAEQLFAGMQQGSRLALAKAITLAESTAGTHRFEAQRLMDLVASSSLHRSAPPAIRVGLSGSPGVGKSTFIESLGSWLTSAKGKRVAVLAVDPSSARTGGSILGDKTRMVELTRDPRAFVRASPSSGTLGGVARATQEAILICEAAGYDVILVETVGVGQSETMVADMVDVFTLLVPPAGGDELQGIKKGIMELVDLVIVNKADGDLVNAARRAQIEYVSALKLLRPKTGAWEPHVISISSVERSGIDKAWESMTNCHHALLSGGVLEKLRKEQRKRWLWRILTDGVLKRLNEDEKIKPLVASLKEQVAHGTKAPGHAADEILEMFLPSHEKAKQHR